MRTTALALLVAALTLSATGCASPPEHSPNDPDVTAARAEATEALPDLSALLPVPGMTAIGDHTVDACGSAYTPAMFSTEDSGLRCTLGSTAVFSLGGATDAATAAATVDAFVAVNAIAASTTMASEVAASTGEEFASEPSVSTGIDVVESLAIRLYERDDIRPELQTLPVQAGGLIVTDDGDWPTDVAAEALSTGALYFAVVESGGEYYDSTDVRPTYGPSDHGGGDQNPPCYGTSGHCPGG